MKGSTWEYPTSNIYDVIRNDISSDFDPSLNLGSFVTTKVDNIAEEIVIEQLGKNLILKNMYPGTNEIMNKTLAMTLELFNHPLEKAYGLFTSGSSEAIMLSLMIHEFNWRHKNRGKSCTPNIIVGANAHTCWFKLASYLGIETRIVSINDDLRINTERIEEFIDENTICVAAVLGSTYIGKVDNIKAINEILIATKKSQGLDIPIHVDAAIGGFVLPFTNPEIQWDFKLEQVKSINISNHKFGMVYPGLGTLALKDEIPEKLSFKVNYLGKEMNDFGINFTRPSYQIIVQYYNYLRYGWIGYKKIMKHNLYKTKIISEILSQTEMFDVLSDHCIPTACFKVRNCASSYLLDLSQELKKQGIFLPIYTLPFQLKKDLIGRIVVRKDIKFEFVIDKIKRILNNK